MKLLTCSATEENRMAYKWQANSLQVDVSTPGPRIDRSDGSCVSDLDIELGDLFESCLAKSLLSELALAVVQELTQERNSEPGVLVRVARCVGHVVGRLAALFFILLHTAQRSSFQRGSHYFQFSLPGHTLVSYSTLHAQPVEHPCSLKCCTSRLIEIPHACDMLNETQDDMVNAFIRGIQQQ